MKLHEILRVKGSTVYTISPEANLDEVVQRLVQYKCGSLLVCVEGPDVGEDPGPLVGIITERDILIACSRSENGLSEQKVSEAMSVDVITGSPDDSLDKIMSCMTENRIRHLPVLENEKLVGLISIGDVVKAQTQRLSMENHYLKTYIQS